MVLDGAIDPAEDTADSIIQQMTGFQVAFNDYAADCAKSTGCPLGTDPAQWVTRYHQLVDPLVAKPGPTADPRGLSYAELAGTMLRLAQQVFNEPLRDDSATSTRYHTFFNVRYAEYLKMDADYRFYRALHDRSSLAFRAAVGWAKPLINQNSMPFETSFFTGGANSNRAWRARSLGPGAYSSSVNNFDRIGEFRIEGNAEYRFKVFGYLEGALFTDVGNIWFLQNNPARPNGEWKADRFLSELAVGTGLGARLNFDFFLVRFDLGLQTKDPSLPAGQRWIFEPKDPANETAFGQKLNFNLGIGYPF